MNLFPKANQLQPYKALHREIIVYFPKKHYTCNYKTIYITANQQQYDMKNKKRLKMLLFSLAILFTGCDYWCQDEYHVINNTDDTLQMVQTISSDVPLNDCIATAEFDNIYRWDEASGESVPVIEGHWKFRFDVRYEDASVTLGGGEVFTQDGMTFTVDSISLSPVAVKVDYTVDSEIPQSNTPSGQLSDEDAREQAR